MSDLDTYVTTSGKATIKKDPDAVLDYVFDWSKWLALVNDTIASVTWILDPLLTKVSSSFTAVTATAFISGGGTVFGAMLPVTCRIVTAGGRTEDRTIYLKITAR